MIDQEDEQALAERARNGDRRAFGLLVERHMRRAYGVALGLVGCREDALDLSQEAFVRAFRARRTLEAGRPFYPWYYQILRRLCLNFLRDQKRRRSRRDGAAPWLIAETALRQSARRPDRQAERGDLRRRLTAAIEELPAREREVFVLKEYDGLRYREIAELVAIPIGTVMSRLYAARKRLAARLEEQR